MSSEDSFLLRGRLGRRAMIKGAGLAAAASALPVAAAAQSGSGTGTAPPSSVGKPDMTKIMGGDRFPAGKQADRSVDPVSYMKTLSNWGRWGKEDVLGTLNHITPAITAAAAKLVRRGESVGCGFKIEASPFGDSVKRYMIMLPTDKTEIFILSEAMARLRKRLGETVDSISMSTHPNWNTHVDALNHLFWDGKMYNGFSSDSVTAIAGAPVGEVAAVTSGVVTRGVLLDMTRVFGVDALQPGQAVKPEHLEEAERRQKVKVRQGDVVMLRCGYDAKYRKAGRRLPYSEGFPGWHASCLPWLHSRKVAAIGNDGPNDAFPSGFEWSDMPVPIHTAGIVAMGLWLIDFCNLEQLAEKCAALGQYEFLYSMSPLRLAGCSASPVQPIAMF